MALYYRLEDASSLLLSDGRTRVQTPEQYLGWHAEQIDARGVARVWHPSLRLDAKVNHGRWLVDCPACGSGAFTHPEWRLACCANCGAVYRGVNFPEQIEEVTRLLLERPRRETQNWVAGEALWKLRFENRVHGLLC